MGSARARVRQVVPEGVGARIRRLAPHLPLGLLVVGSLVQGAWVLHLVRTSWFGTDDLNFLTTRGPLPAHDLGLWRPYAGHWSTVPVLVYRGLFAVFGMHSYVPYAAVVVMVHLASVLATYALLRAVGTRPWPAALTGWVLLFYGNGAEAFMVAAAMNHTIPLLLALVASVQVVRTGGGERALRAATVLAVVVVMCSATGLTMLVLLGGVVWVHVGVRPALRVVWPAAAAFVAWFALYGHEGGRASMHVADLQLVPSFLWEGLTGAGGTGLGIGRAGAVLLGAALVAVVVRRVGPSPLRRQTVVGAVVALVQLTLVTLGDARLGSAIAGLGRYVYIVLFLMAPGIALLAQVCADGLRAVLRHERLARLGRDGRAARLVPLAAGLVVVAVLSAYTRSGVQRERVQAQVDAGTGGVFRSWAYGSLAAVDAGERQLSFQWGFIGAPFELLASPALRSRMAAPPAADTRLDAEAQWFVVAGPDDPGLFSPTRPSFQGLVGRGAARPGCHDLTAAGRGPVTIDVPSQTGTEIGVTSNSGQVKTQLFRRYTPSPVRTWSVTPGAVYVATTARVAIMRVTFDGTGTFTVCHQ